VMETILLVLILAVAVLHLVYDLGLLPAVWARVSGWRLGTRVQKRWRRLRRRRVSGNIGSDRGTSGPDSGNGQA
jgi:hypothetical protein